MLPCALQYDGTRRLGEVKIVILPQRVQSTVRAIRSIRNTRVFHMQSRVVADERMTTQINQHQTNQSSPIMMDEEFSVGHNGADNNQGQRHRQTPTGSRAHQCLQFLAQTTLQDSTYGENSTDQKWKGYAL